MRNGKIIRKEIIKPVRQFWIVKALMNTSYQELLAPHLHNVHCYWAYHGQYYISNWVLDNHLAPVVQKMDGAIQRINLCPVDSAIGFPNTYPLDSDLSGG